MVFGTLDSARNVSTPSMRHLIFLRSAIVIILVNGSACFGTTLHTRRDEKTDALNASIAASTTGIHPTRAETIDRVQDQDKSLINDQNEEARGKSLVDFLTPAVGHMVDPNVEKGETIAKLSSKLRAELEPGTEGGPIGVAKVLEHEHWLSMKKEADEWLLAERVNPKTMFSYMHLERIFEQDVDMVTMSHDPKLLLWFRYIIKYRRIASTGAGYAAFDNKALLGLLASHMKPRMGSHLTLPLHDQGLFDSHMQVVIMFDLYRHELPMESFATKMLTYMVTDLTTKDFVLDRWLQQKETPSVIFEVLHLGDAHGLTGIDDLTVFTSWLEYLKKYFESNAVDFKIRDFLNLQLSAMSTPRGKAMFESNALEKVLKDVKLHKEDLAAYVRDVWQHFPYYLFKSLRLSGEKITEKNFPAFVVGISYVAAYMKSRPFDGDLVFDMLNPVHSYDEVSWLFEELLLTHESMKKLTMNQRLDVMKFADRMLLYLSDSSSMLQLSPYNVHPEIFWKSYILEHVEFSNVKTWFAFSVAYFRRVKKHRSEDAIIDVIFLLQKKMGEEGLSRDEWIAMVGELGKENARIQSAWKAIGNTLRPSRKRKSSLT